MGIVRSEIDRSTNRSRAHLISLLDHPEQNLFETVGICQQLIVIDLHKKRNLVSVLARHRSQHTKRGSDRVAATFDRQLDDVLWVEIVRILGKACTAGMLDTLIHRQN